MIGKNGSALINRQNRPFDYTLESRECYVERFEQYFKVNEMTLEKKVYDLLCLIGSKLYLTTL